MPDLIERCGRQLRGECKNCRFDCLNKKREKGEVILYSLSNSQCVFYERTIYVF